MNIRLILTVLAIFCGSITATYCQVAQFPFKFQGSQIVIKARTKNSDYLRFIFDSGTTGATIDSATLEKLGLKKTERSITTIAGSGGIMTYTLATNQSLKLADAEIKNINFAMVDFTKLSATTGSRIDGIIGYELLNQYVTQLDFDTKQIKLYKGVESVDTTDYVGIPFEFNKNIMIPRFPISITLANGDSFTGKAMFDTGNSFSLIVSTPFSKFHNFNGKIGNTELTVGQGINATTTDQIATIKSMSFNGFKFGAMSIRLTVNDLAEPKDGYLGIMGIEIIKRFNIIFDYGNRKIYLKPNSAYYSPLTQVVFKDQIERESLDFLSQNKSRPGVKITSSGLQYKIIKQGRGAKATMEDRVALHFTIRNLQGKKIYSTYDEKKPWLHHLDKALDGVKEAVLMMPVGSKWILYIPSNLAFGDEGFENLPGGAAIMCEVEVISF